MFVVGIISAEMFVTMSYWCDVTEVRALIPSSFYRLGVDLSNVIIRGTALFKNQCSEFTYSTIHFRKAAIYANSFMYSLLMLKRLNSKVVNQTAGGKVMNTLQNIINKKIINFQIPFHFSEK